ncbi:phosphatidylinositol-glycan biosynthesis class F protein isoform X3 [Hydra vulgaris]|uniref:Phosphatidylinositol-glycan biosynthesis class F protein isoform X3 n=1 Tax=Hydra vulgaris TaxID=6087 RepID=A0ABM4CGM5_HYDVU
MQLNIIKNDSYKQCTELIYFLLFGVLIGYFRKMFENSSLKYSLSLFLYELVLLIIFFAFGISPLLPVYIGTFLKYFTSLMLLGNYLILRYLSKFNTRQVQGKINEIKLVAYSLLIFVIGAFFFHCISFFLGAPLFENFIQTLLFACLLSSLAIFPLSVVNKGKWEVMVDDLANSIDIKSCLADSLKFISCSTIIGGWLGAFPIPLDWDRDWQVIEIFFRYVHLQLGLLHALSVQ